MLNPTQRVMARLVNEVEAVLNSWDWSWPHLAERAGVSVSTIHKVRLNQYKDSPRLSTVVKIAKAVGLEVRVQKPKKLTIRRTAA